MEQDEFEFNEENHTYTLNGQRLSGVTTILGMIGGEGSGALIQWAANMAVDFLKGHFDLAGRANNDWSMEQWEEILKNAKSAHRKKKEDAGQKGTDVHAILEERIKQAIKDTNGFIDGHELNEEPQVSHFIEWAMTKGVKFLESEKRLYSKKLFVAGTCDFVCEIDGKKYVGDIKTGGVYNRIPLAQTAAYRMLLEEMGEKDFVGSVVVNIKKDGKFNEEKNVYWGYDYKQDLRLFMGALEIYRVMNNVPSVIEKVKFRRKCG